MDNLGGREESRSVAKPIFGLIFCPARSSLGEEHIGKIV